MRSKYTLLFLLLISLLLFESCQSESNNAKDFLVAKVGGAKLNFSDLRDNFGPDLQLKDLNVKAFIHNWVRNQVVLQAAQKALTEKEKDFSKELKDYKNSLLRYTYESKLVDQQTDTIVTEEQIKLYYEQNSKNFELKENFVKARIIKLDRKLKDLSTVKNLFNYSDSLGKVKFESALIKNKISYVITDSAWMKWQTVKEIVPFKPYNDEYFLSNSNYRELWQEKELWLIKISDFQLKDNTSPLEMVESKIKSILINRRKMSFLKQNEQELYNSAIKKGEIKLFLNKKIDEGSAYK